MRITQNMLTHGALRDLAANVESLQKASEQVATTKRLNRPSDSPADVQAAIKLNDNLAELQQYMRNIDAAKTQVTAADTALSGAGDVIQRARELAVEGANGTLSASDRGAIAEEVDQLLGQLVQDASAKSGDTYVFSGFKVTTPPYTYAGAGSVSPYGGDQGGLMARVAPGVTLQTNIAGDAVFGNAIAALQSLYADLTGGQTVQASTISSLDTGLNDVLGARATLGARSNRLDDTKSFHQDVELSGKQLLSNLVDVDMASAISDLTNRQLTYQAALKVNAQILQTSLIDALR